MRVAVQYLARAVSLPGGTSCAVWMSSHGRARSETWEGRLESRCMMLLAVICPPVHEDISPVHLSCP